MRASDATPTRKRRSMTAKEKKGGVRADDSPLGRTQKASCEVAHRWPAVAPPTKLPRLRGGCA